MADLPKNPFKAAILAGEVQLGLWSGIRDSIIVEMLGDCGYDFVTIDCEHAANDLSDVIMAAQVLRSTAAHMAARVPGLDPVVLKRILDAGVQAASLACGWGRGRAGLRGWRCRQPPGSGALLG